MIRRLIVLTVVVTTAAVMTACADSGSGSTPNAANGSSAAPSAHKVFAVGQAMTNDAHQTVTVTAFKRGVSSGNEFEQPSPGHECVQTDLALFNGDKTTWNLPTSEMTVVDSNGQSYTSSFTCGGDTNEISGLVPGGKANASLRFEVPTGTPLLFTWTPSLFNQNSTYQTKLA